MVRLRALGGVPLEQLNLLSRNPEVFVERLVEVLTTRIWKPDNYFYYGYIVGEFSPEVCPRYLEKKNFAVMKQRVDRVKVYHGTWAEAAVEEGPGSVTIASLLDSMDWMPPGMIAENIGKVVANMDKKKGRIFWRSFADRVHSPSSRTSRANSSPPTIASAGTSPSSSRPCRTLTIPPCSSVRAPTLVPQIPSWTT